MQRQVAHEAVGVVVGQENLRRAGGEDHRPVHLRVEALELVGRDAGELDRQADIDVVLDRHAQEVRVVHQLRQLQAEAFRPRDDVLHRLQLGHVALRLGRHAQALVVGRQAGALVLRDRPLDAAFAPVVGGEREMPVAEHAVELLQVVERRAGRGEDVAAVVAEDVLLQLEVAARRGDELPHPRCARHRHRLRVVGALDEGQERELGRHAALVELLDDVEQVAAAALGHAGDVVGSRRVPALALAHEIAVEVGHREAAADAVPEVDARGAIVEIEVDVGPERIDRHGRGDDFVRSRPPMRRRAGCGGDRCSLRRRREPASRRRPVGRRRDGRRDAAGEEEKGQREPEEHACARAGLRLGSGRHRNSFFQVLSAGPQTRRCSVGASSTTAGH